MKSSIKDFFSKYDQIRSFLKRFNEEILNGKLHFCAVEITIAVINIKKMIALPYFRDDHYFQNLVLYVV